MARWGKIGNGRGYHSKDDLHKLWMKLFLTRLSRGRQLTWAALCFKAGRSGEPRHIKQKVWGIRAGKRAKWVRFCLREWSCGPVRGTLLRTSHILARGTSWSMSIGTLWAACRWTCLGVQVALQSRPRMPIATLNDGWWKWLQRHYFLRCFGPADCIMLPAFPSHSSWFGSGPTAQVFPVHKF